MEQLNYTETDLFIQTLYFIWLKENRKVIDIDDIASFNAIIKDIAEEKGIKVSYYNIEDKERTIEDYFRINNRKYILFPWYSISDIELEMPDIIIDNKAEIISKLKAKDNDIKLEYEELYQSLEKEIQRKTDIDFDLVRKRK